MATFEITKGNSNTIRVSLAELQTLASPTFLLEFINDSSQSSVTCISADVSAFPKRYNEFVVVEKASPVALSGEVELNPVGFYTYNVYEQTSTTNLEPSLADKLLETGTCRVIFDGDRHATAFTTYQNPADSQVFFDVFEEEGIVVTPPSSGGTYKNSDDSFVQVITGGSVYTAPDIIWTDSDLSVNTAPANTDITCTPAGYDSSIAYTRPPLTGNPTSYNNYDDKWQYDNGTYDYTPVDGARPTSLSDFLTLNHNNSFANTLRFTNDLGGSVNDGSDGSTQDYIIDHYTGLGYSRVLVFDSHIDILPIAEATTRHGFSDWRLTNSEELYSIIKKDQTGFLLNYTPFDIVTTICGTSTTAVTSLYSYVVKTFDGFITSNTKAQNNLNIFCRNHFV